MKDAVVVPPARFFDRDDGRIAKPPSHSTVAEGNALEDRLSARATTPAANPPISAIASECVAPRCPKGPHTGHRTENR
jgi:hypothetical protein